MDIAEYQHRCRPGMAIAWKRRRNYYWKMGQKKYIPMHLQECFKDLKIPKGSLPVAEEISKTELSIPMFYGMTDDEIQYVIEKLNEF